jgi:nucleotide-binding universal stress UspA family protein
MKKILFPTDFSAASRNAFLYALQLADKLGARLLWLHVIYDGPSSSSEEQAIELEIARNAFFDDYQQARKAFGIQVELAPLIEGGVAVSSILDIAEKEAVEMIVIGSKGARMTPAGEMGGIAAYLLGQTRIPMLIIPEKTPFRGISKMIFANDFKAEDLRILKNLLVLAQKLGATIECIHIRPDNQAWDRTQSNYYEQLFYFDQQTDQVNFQIQTQNNVEQAIYEAVEQDKEHVLVMLAHHRDSRETFEMESLTHKIALHTDVPLLALKA